MSQQLFTGRVTHVSRDNSRKGRLIFCLALDDNPFGRELTFVCGDPAKAAAYFSMLGRIGLHGTRELCHVWVEGPISEHGNNEFIHAEPVNNATTHRMLLRYSLQYKGKTDDGWRIYIVNSNLGDSEVGYAPERFDSRGFTCKAQVTMWSGVELTTQALAAIAQELAKLHGPERS